MQPNRAAEVWRLYAIKKVKRRKLIWKPTKRKIHIKAVSFQELPYYTTPRAKSKGDDLMSVYKDEKHNTWYARFRYRDWRGVTHQTTKRGFKTKREAKDYEAETVRTAAKSFDMRSEK